MFGPSKLHILKGENEALDSEMKLYHYKENTDGTISEEIADEYNHAIDALRYIMLNIFSEGSKLVVSLEPEAPHIATIMQQTQPGYSDNHEFMKIIHQKYVIIAGMKLNIIKKYLLKILL